MKSLDEMFNESSTDKGSKMHDYARTYDALFSHLKDQPIRFLEIGVEFGLSAKVWLEYFSKATLFGVDIKRQHSIQDTRFHFTEGDQRSHSFWKGFLQDNGGQFDVVLDDGCHHSSGIMVSFGALWPYVKPGGLYIVEDLMCSYYASCQEEGWPLQMEFLKSLVDSVNAQTQYKNTEELRQFPNGTRSDLDIYWIRFSEELCVICKK